MNTASTLRIIINPPTTGAASDPENLIFIYLQIQEYLINYLWKIREIPQILMESYSSTLLLLCVLTSTH